MQTIAYDATVGIIGAGPLGVEFAIALKQAKISYLQFDQGQAGQMISNFPPETIFFSSSEKIAIAGIPIQNSDQQKCSREEYLAYLRSVIMQNQLKINSYEEVNHVEKTQHEGFLLKTLSSRGVAKYRIQYLVLATGGTSKPRMLHVPGEARLHVSTKLEDPHKYFQKRVLVVGGKNSAAEAALRCYHAGAEVAMAIRKEHFDPNDVKYWILPELLSCIAREEIRCYYQSEVVEILSDSVLLRKKDISSSIDVPADFVIKAIGFEAEMKLFHQLGIPLIEPQDSPSYNEDSMETTVENAFVLGTVAGGTQKKYRIFIENTHTHVFKILQTLCAKLDIKEPSLGWQQQCIQESSKRLEE